MAVSFFIIVFYGYVSGDLPIYVVSIQTVQGQAQCFQLILPLFQLAFLLATRSNLVSLVQLCPTQMAH